MLYREIIAVCSEIHTEHINTLCGQNVALLNVKPGGTDGNYWVCRANSVLECYGSAFKLKVILKYLCCLFYKRPVLRNYETSFYST
jgi:hypothetical protein